jgi:hypothetical protein
MLACIVAQLCRLTETVRDFIIEMKRRGQYCHLTARVVLNAPATAALHQFAPVPRDLVASPISTRADRGLT